MFTASRDICLERRLVYKMAILCYR